jgi:hypothetical protein
MEENKYLKLDFFQGILLFVISCLCSLLKHAKHIFLYLLHSNDDHENIAIVYPPLKFLHVYPHYITNFDKTIPSGPCDDHNQVDEPHETRFDISSLALDPTPSKT